MTTDTRCTIFRIAEQYVATHYPDFDTVKNPPTLKDNGSAWEVFYELPPTMLGGTPVVVIDKGTMKVTRAYHTQ